MYDIDKITKAFMSRADIFADAVNFVFSAGRRLSIRKIYVRAVPASCIVFAQEAGGFAAWSVSGMC